MTINVQRFSMVSGCLDVRCPFDLIDGTMLSLRQFHDCCQLAWNLSAWAWMSVAIRCGTLGRSLVRIYDCKLAVIFVFSLLKACYAALHRRPHYALQSVRPSVCPVATVNSKTEHCMTTAPILLADYVTTGNGLKNGVHCGL